MLKKIIIFLIMNMSFVVSQQTSDNLFKNWENKFSVSSWLFFKKNQLFKNNPLGLFEDLNYRWKFYQKGLLVPTTSRMSIIHEFLKKLEEDPQKSKKGLAASYNLSVPYIQIYYDKIPSGHQVCLEDMETKARMLLQQHNNKWFFSSDVYHIKYTCFQDPARFHPLSENIRKVLEIVENKKNNLISNNTSEKSLDHTSTKLFIYTYPQQKIVSVEDPIAKRQIVYWFNNITKTWHMQWRIPTPCAQGKVAYEMLDNWDLWKKINRDKPLIEEPISFKKPSFFQSIRSSLAQWFHNLY